MCTVVLVTMCDVGWGYSFPVSRAEIRASQLDTSPLKEDGQSTAAFNGRQALMGVVGVLPELFWLTRTSGGIRDYGRLLAIIYVAIFRWTGRG